MPLRIFIFLYAVNYVLQQVTSNDVNIFDLNLIKREEDLSLPLNLEILTEQLRNGMTLPRLPESPKAHSIPFQSDINKENPIEKNDSKPLVPKSTYGPGSTRMSFVKRFQKYNPALKYIGLGKRPIHFGPVLKYIGLDERLKFNDSLQKFSSDTKAERVHRTFGKSRESENISEASNGYFGFNLFLKTRYWKGLQKKENYSTSLKRDWLTERKLTSNGDTEPTNLEFQYDPTVHYFGLKKYIQNDPELRYGSLRKRALLYDPAGMLIGLEKIQVPFRPAANFIGFGKRGFRSSMIYLGFGKKEYLFDPSYTYMFTRHRLLDSDLVAKSLVPTKRDVPYDTMLNSMVPQKKFQYDPAANYMGLGKRGPCTNPDPSKTIDTTLCASPKLKNWYAVPITTGAKLSPSGHLNLQQVSRTCWDSEKESEDNQEPGINAKQSNRGEKLAVQKRSANRIRYVKEDSDHFNLFGKRPYKYDPALHFMGLGKRQEKYHRMISGSNPAQSYTKNENQDERFQDDVEESTRRKELFNQHENKPTTSLKTLKLRTSQRSLQSEQNRRGGHNKGPKESQNHSDSPTKSYGITNKKQVFPSFSVNDVEKEVQIDNLLLDDGIKTKQNSNKDWTSYLGATLMAQTSKPKRLDIWQKFNRSSMILLPEQNTLADMKTNDDQELWLTPSFFDADHMTPREINAPYVNKESGKLQRERSLSLMKRHRDNQRKYNPGWIFIGLGKRQNKQYNQFLSSTTVYEPDNILKDHYALLNNLRELSFKTPNDPSRIKLRVGF